MPIRCRAAGLLMGLGLVLSMSMAGPGRPGEAPAALPPLPIPLGPDESLEGEDLRIERDGRLSYTSTVLRPGGFLGVEVRPVDRDTAGRLGLAPFEGLLAVSVERDGPAFQAGLARDDVIVIIGDHPVRSVPGFIAHVEESPPGSTVVLGIVRDGVRGDLPVLVGSRFRRAEETLAWSLSLTDDRRRTGMVLAEAPPEARSALARTAGAAEGLLVADLLPGGPAFRAGILPGDLVVAAGSPEAAGARPLREILPGLPPGIPASVTVQRGRARLERTLTPAEDATVVRECRGPLSVMSWTRSAEESRTAILWGLLYRSAEVASLEGPRGTEPALESSWAAFFDIVRRREKGRRGELRILWVIPIGF